MKPLSTEWRQTLYALAWLGGGVAMTALAVWLVVLVRWDWPAATAPQRLEILGNALLASLLLAGLVQLGLGLRNAIRNIKGTAAGVSFEANAHGPETKEEEQQP